MHGPCGMTWAAWPRHPRAQESFALLDYAMSRGVNFFDTAEL